MRVARRRQVETFVRDKSPRRFQYTEHRGPGTGWGVRLRVRQVVRALDAEGYTIVVRSVGRQGRLRDAGLLQGHFGEDGKQQDRLGMGAVVVAVREDAGASRITSTE